MFSALTRSLPRAIFTLRSSPITVTSTARVSHAFPLTFVQTPSLLDSNGPVVRWYRSNRSRRGLYDGKDIRTGNNVSFSMRHTKRTFKPNVFIKRVYSDILDGMIQFHLTSSTLRSIDKAGGIDNYLMKNEFTEGEGYKFKKKMLKRLKNQAYLKRKAGDAPPVADIAAV